MTTFFVTLLSFLSGALFFCIILLFIGVFYLVFSVRSLTQKFDMFLNSSAGSSFLEGKPDFRHMIVGSLPNDENLLDKEKTRNGQYL